MHAELAAGRMAPLFHITSRREAEAARELGSYRPEAPCRPSWLSIRFPAIRMARSRRSQTFEVLGAI
jgi:hypothetical protein